MSVKVIALNVVLSLVAETEKSERPSGNSAKTTILAVVGVELAVNVSDISVILVLETLYLLSATIITPEPPMPPKPTPAGDGIDIPPPPPPPRFAVPSVPGKDSPVENATLIGPSGIPPKNGVDAFEISFCPTPPPKGTPALGGFESPSSLPLPPPPPA